MKNDTLHERMAQLDGEFSQDAGLNQDRDFKNFLEGLKFVRKFSEDQMATFSPLDVISDFEHRGLQRLSELSPDEMMGNESGLKKLLANMLQQCRPGSLTNDDVDQLSGINGREAQGANLEN